MLIDTYHERWLDRLIAPVEAPRGGRPIYLFIDGVFAPGLHRRFNAVLRSTVTSTLLFEHLPGCTSEVRDVSPFVTPFHSPNASLLTLLGRCSGWPMVSVLETSESQLELTDRLAAWCVVEAGGQYFNLRFADTRRLPAIFDALTAKQRIEFAGPATRWSYIDRKGCWVDLPVPNVPSAIAARAGLSDQQFAKLLSSSEVDEMFSILASRHPIAGLHSENYARLDMALRAANKINLDGELKIAWCEACLLERSRSDHVPDDQWLAQWISCPLR